MPVSVGEAKFLKRLAGLGTQKMDMKDTADVSCYMLFEATGDSEADCDPIIDDFAYGFARADDDAQSCSYDGSDICIVDEVISGYDSCDAAADDEHKDENAQDEEEADHVYGMSYCEDDDLQKHQKSGVSVDSGQELADEMEKNRLFWEACLAS